MSIGFYGWWNPSYLIIIIGSVAINYLLGRYLQYPNAMGRKLVFILGIAFNLCLLGYFKYFNFFIDNINAISDHSWSAVRIALPLGISFFTFQQVAFLVDAYQKRVSDTDPLNYSLFVSFFPQLIAGPIVHHKEMMDQFDHTESNRFSLDNFLVGLTIFSFGLAKKLVIADAIAPIANSVFDHAVETPPHLWDAWFATLAYTLQLYFDFSGYSDMAIGLGRMFNITLPINFNSPYKAQNIIDFWRRWHMTLSRFLRDYLYVPLGGSRKGPVRILVNLWIVMLLGGLWHGAGWTFVAWGALHALYLCINHVWHRRNSRWKLPLINRVAPFMAWSCTFVCVMIGWSFFRAETFNHAFEILRGMIGLNGASIPVIYPGLYQQILQAIGIESLLKTYSTVPSAIPASDGILLSLLLLFVVICPNTAQIMHRARATLESPVYQGRLAWRMNRGWAVITGAVCVSCLLNLNRVSEFIYWQF